MSEERRVFLVDGPADPFPSSKLEEAEPMNLRLFVDEHGHWFIRGFGYSGNGPTPEDAMRDLVLHHNTHEKYWPVKRRS